MRYQRIVALVESSQAELAAGLLAAAGLGFELRDGGTLERAPDGMTGLVVYSAENDGSLAGRVGGLLGGAAIEVTLSASTVDEAAWRDVWKQFFRPRRVGPFVVVPSWEAYAARHGELVLDLDPGVAFGTGGHASTRLCLEAIGAYAGPVGRFLDVGAGSGILAIACAKRWPAARGLGVDVDPEAIEATRANLMKNGVADRVTSGPVEAMAGAFDLVVANLSGPTLVEQGPALAARRTPGGHLVVSGLLATEADWIAERFRDLGLSTLARRDEEGWSALELGAG